MDATWFDAIDHFPQVVCEVEDADEKITRGVYAAGDWETPDGEWIRTPKRFRVIGYRILTPIYSIDTLWETNDETQHGAEND